MDYLQQYDYPGNVRELENILIQALVLTQGEILLKENIILPKKELENDSTEFLSLYEVEKRHIIKVLKKVKGNKNKAIKILGISKPTLYNKLAQYS